MLQIIKKLKNKNIFDVLLRLKRIYYQLRVINSKVNFYSDDYLLKNVIEKDINSLIKRFKESENKLFNSKVDLKIDKELIKSAELIIQHKFNLLGSGVVSLNYGERYNGVKNINYSDQHLDLKPNRENLPNHYDSINWLIDFKSGYQWDGNIFYSKVRGLTSYEGVDIKVPWELSRCQHFGILGTAFRMTGESKYAEEIKNEIVDWINNNSYCYGPNWVCAMDVGIRVSNWLMAYELTKESGIYDDSFLLYFLKSLLHHLKYLLNNLEWTSKLTSNHYLSDLAGLYFLSKYFDSYRGITKINKFCINELEKEIFKQTYDDGMNSEGSTSYHRLVLEIFTYCSLLDKSTSGTLSEKYHNRLKKMFDFSRFTMKDNGTIVQIGDNDSGLFFKFKQRHLLNHSYLLILDNILYGRKYKSDSYQLQGPENHIFKYQSNEELSIDNPRLPLTSKYDNAGFYLYKNNHIYITVYNGPNGQKGNGGHAHNDKLSFTLDYKGHPVFVDPGTYLYTPFPEERNRFRSTKSHNTVTVSDKEQNEFIDGYLFGLKEDCNELNNFCDSNNDKGFYFSGSHNGYERLGKGLIHHREVIYNDDVKKIEIIDSFEDQVYLKKASFIMNKKIINRVDENKVIFNNGEIKFKNLINLSMTDYFFSDGYGEKNNDSFFRLEVEFKSVLKTTISLI